MFNVSIFPLIQGVIVITALSCAVPPEKNSNAGDAKKKADPIDIETSQPSCIPTGANNNCSSLANSSEVDKCWVKILDSDKAKACAAKGKFYNRISKQCADVATMTLKSGCTMQDVYTVNGQAGYTKELIDTNVATVKGDIKGPEGLATTEEPILDQCIQTTTKDNKAFLIPIFLGKKYTGGVDGHGTYQIHSGKICDTRPICKPGETCDYVKTHTLIPSCLDASLSFQVPTDPVTQQPKPEVFSCN